MQCKTQWIRMAILVLGVWGGGRADASPPNGEPVSKQIRHSDSTLAVNRTGALQGDSKSGRKKGDAPLSIERSNSHSGGTFLNVHWSPSAPVGAFIALSEEPVEIGYDESGFPTVSGPCLFKTHTGADEAQEVFFTNLEPDRKYYYAILPKNDSVYGNGQVIPHYQSAVTKKRCVHVKITELDVIDDSDDLSDGEMAFTFLLLKPGVHPKDALDDDLHDFIRWPALSGNESAGEGYLSVASGKTLLPSVDLDGSNVDDAVTLAVSGFDDDVEGVYDVAPLPYPNSYTGAFNQHYGEANANYWSLDVRGGTFESASGELIDVIDYWESEQFEYKLVAKVAENDITCLEFKVHFTVSVFYVND